MRRLDFEEGFPNRELHGIVYVELLYYLYGEENRVATSMKRKRNPNVTSDAARIWSKMVSQHHEKFGLEQSVSLACLLIK